MDLNEIRQLIHEGKFLFYAHALTEAKKDGVTPEDAIHVILTGEVIETYSERQRILILGALSANIPLHVVCDCSQSQVVFIVTVYIPDKRSWFRAQKRK